MLENLHDYSDIYYAKKPELRYHKMTMKQRAAQFAPFAALTGYEEAVKEKGRVTYEKILLDNNMKELIDYKLQEIANDIDEKPFVKVNYFVKDKLKTGGRYVDYEGEVKNIDTLYRKIAFISGKIIDIEDVFSLDY